MGQCRLKSLSRRARQCPSSVTARRVLPADLGRAGLRRVRVGAVGLDASRPGRCCPVAVQRVAGPSAVRGRTLMSCAWAKILRAVRGAIGRRLLTAEAATPGHAGSGLPAGYSFGASAV
jgi:hypothetical protein